MTGVPGVRVEPVAGGLTVRVLREPKRRTPEQAAAIDRAWRELCVRNPRYFNGRILSFESYDAGTGVATARDEEYRAHAARGAADLGLAFFGVTGILSAPGAGGRERRFLVARRSGTVHDYPGQWEFGPCGGIDPPGAGVEALTPADLAAEVEREAREELGIDLAGARPRALALVHDGPVGSTDLMMLVELPGVPEAAGNWEVSDTRWVTLGELAAWCAARPGEVIPTTRAMAAWLRGRGF